MSNYPSTLDAARNRQLVNELLVDATRDLERLRELVAPLASRDESAWLQVRTLAHNLAARAQALKLVVLDACAHELEELASERLEGAAPDRYLMLCVSSAIEALALELDQLSRA
jgi:hypothetical protein